MSTNLPHSSSSGEMSDKDVVLSDEDKFFTSQYNEAAQEYDLKMNFMSTELVLILTNAIFVAFGVNGMDDVKKAPVANGFLAFMLVLAATMRLTSSKLHIPLMQQTPRQFFKKVEEKAKAKGVVNATMAIICFAVVERNDFYLFYLLVPYIWFIYATDLSKSGIVDKTSLAWRCFLYDVFIASTIWIKYASIKPVDFSLEVYGVDFKMNLTILYIVYGFLDFYVFFYPRHAALLEEYSPKGVDYGVHFAALSLMCSDSVFLTDDIKSLNGKVFREKYMIKTSRQDDSFVKPPMEMQPI